MKLDFEKVKDEIELVSEGTGMSGAGRYIRASVEEGEVPEGHHTDAKSMSSEG
ncbi:MULTISPECIES: hypothetical protein [Metallosphaera]|uniref:hypothetical protein n=1 Tax=Metallosphaera TaxID=41980 RepID=UPI001F056400|nr:hypothetical protein [Metallosphaera sedula]MCH1770304.1 hypothetical protein [Metallosphaera sedula]MCP6727862.1 hypothetical protein [Metallosphaera sedula]